MSARILISAVWLAVLLAAGCGGPDDGPATGRSGRRGGGPGALPDRDAGDRDAGDREARVRRPNMIVLVADDLAPRMLGFDGNPRARTPHLDSLAAGGVVFDRAYVPLAQCGPSRAALLTGRYPHRLGVLTNEGARLPPRTPALAGVLRRSGYRCGFVGKWGLGGENEPQGGFRDYWRPLAKTGAYADPRVWVDGERVGFEGWMPDVLTTLGIEFIEARDDEHPFLLWISFKTPHVPLTTPPHADVVHAPEDVLLPAEAAADAPPDAGEIAAHARSPARRDFLARGQEDVRAQRATYASMVSALDRSVGRLIAHLEQRGLADDTLLVFLSDNGWLLGEHRMFGKGAACYEELVRVPMFVHWPARLEPGRRTGLVSSLDLFPTLATLGGADLALEGGDDLDGVDLWPLLSGASERAHESLLLEYWKKKPQGAPTPMLGIVTENAKYARYLDSGEEEYYDLSSDPREQRNLAGSAAHAGEVERLRALLAERAQGVGAPIR